MVAVLFAANVCRSPSALPALFVCKETGTLIVMVLPVMKKNTLSSPADDPNAVHKGRLKSIADVQSLKDSDPTEVAEGKLNVVADVEPAKT